MPDSPRAHPERVGPYRILEVLGEGGMGVVYRAEQREPVVRDVALKMLKRGMDSERVVARFEAERQALAVMEHPSIAKVFDAGVSEDGRPYFVMEVVRGVPLTEHADRARLTVRERVRLLARVARAVQHAHQKGVIHRDLKPSNVLVTEADGTPLPQVIDFGIAKAVERASGGDDGLTQFDQTLGTPAYMSPEQAGLADETDVDTRTDVYSLGVLLYELLAGDLPFEASAYRGRLAAAGALSRDPPRPSARLQELGDRAGDVASRRSTDPRGLRRALEGDLDWIVLKAMDRERDRRYETANALAADLERHLADEPVSARPPSTAYRMRKFVRRHRASVGFAAVVALLLVGFAATMTVQANRIAQARDEADRRRGQAEEVIDFMLGDLTPKLSTIGRLDVLDDVNRQAQSYFAALEPEDLTDDELSRRSTALSQMGQTRLGQGDFGAALDAFRESLELARGLAARHPDDADAQVALGAAHFWVGYIHWREGDLEAALGEFEPYLEISRALVARDSTNLAWRTEVGYAHSNIGSVREAQGDLEGALESFRRSLAIKEGLVAADPDNDAWRLDLAQAHNTLGVALARAGDLEGAERQHAREVELKQALVASDTTQMPWRETLAVARYFHAEALEARGAYREALEERTWDLALQSALVARDPENAEWRRSEAVSRWTLGRTQLALGRLDEARANVERGLALLEALAADFPERSELDLNAAQARLALAEVLLEAGEAGDAPGDADGASGAVDAPGPPGASDASSGPGASGGPGASDAVRDALREARRALASATELLEDQPELAPARVTRIHAHALIGRAHAALGDSGEARAAWERALELGDDTPPRTMETEPLALRSELRLRLGRLDEARADVAELDRRGYRGWPWARLREASGV